MTAFALILGAPAQSACISERPSTASPSSIQTFFEKLLSRDRFKDVPAVIPLWRALIADAERTPGTSPEIVARANGWLAWSLDYIGKVDEAVAPSEAGARIVRERRLDTELYSADVISALSMVEVDLGKIDAGATRAAQAMAIVERLGPESAQASFANNAVAGAAYAGGRYEEAARAFGAASEIAVKCLPANDGFIVNQMASHAGVLYMLGRNEEALAQNERAANWALANLREDSPVVTLALGNLGVMLRSAGRYAEAEAALRRVVDLEAKYQKNSWYYRAISLSNFASVIDRQGRHEEAEALWLKSSSFHKQSSQMKRDPVQAAYPLRFSADAAQARGDLALALSRRAEGIRLVEAATPGDHPELARARVEYGRTLTLLGRGKDGLAAAAPAIEIVRAKLPADDVKRLTAEIDYARIVAGVSGAEAGYAIAAPIAARLETRLLDAATARGDLLRFGPAFSSSFAAVTELALATGRHEAAFHALQLANLSDIVIVNSDVAARAAAGDGAAGRAVRRLQDRVRERQSLDRSRSFAASSGQTAELARLDGAIQSNDAAIAAAARELDRSFPAYRALSRPVPVTLDAFRAGLTADQFLAAPLPVDDGTLSIVVTRDGLSWRKTPVARSTVTELAGQIRRSIDAARDTNGRHAAFAAAAARTLYGAILPNQVRAATAGRHDMLYLASGSLAAIPPALLIAPGSSGGATRWLIRDHSVTIMPSLAAQRRQRDGTRRAVGFLGIGAPETGAVRGESANAIFRGVSADRAAIGRLPALPRASDELRRMAALFGGTPTLLLGSAATEAAVKALPLDRFGIVAIATHALGGNDFAGLTEPALVLTPSGDDGLMTASDIARLRLDADWVILSACDTASGMGAGSPAYSGLASAFMQAGARALLVSHWPVRDDAAAALTVATVSGTRAGLSRARALQRAMVSLLDGASLPAAAHPAIWAPFVLIDR